MTRFLFLSKSDILGTGTDFRNKVKAFCANLGSEDEAYPIGT